VNDTVLKDSTVKDTTDQFADQVVLVTGASAGIGLAIARYFKSAGARVFCAQRSAANEFETITADFSDENAPATVIDHIADCCGQLNVLVNNAGVMQETSIADTKLGDWQRSLMVNLTSPFLLIQAALPLLEKSQGSIVNIASIEGIAANPLHTAYCSSKAGLIGLTRSTAVDLGPSGIRCNAVAPGWIDTNLNNEFIEAQADPVAFKAGIAGIHPLGRTGSPEDVARLVGFLASQANQFITGQTYVIDGGRTSKLSLP